MSLDPENLKKIYEDLSTEVLLQEEQRLQERIHEMQVKSSIIAKVILEKVMV